jgi:ribosomal protein S18 acetylase RimI-like enzyme
LHAGDETQWRSLWRSYCEFYQVSLSDAVTAHTWRNIVANDRVIGLAASRGGELAGFGIAVLHDATWSEGPSAYLEDLFVREDERGRGIGRAIIDELILRGRAEGWGAIYWHTRADNAAARRLYDSYCPADDFVRYRLFLEPIGSAGRTALSRRARSRG